MAAIKQQFILNGCLVFLVLNLFARNLIHANSSCVCYQKVGCFSDQFPWRSFPKPVPLPVWPEIISRFMYYHNREYPDGVVFSIFPVLDIPSEWKNKNVTFVIIHGFTANGRKPWIKKLKDTLLKKRDANILVVDYGIRSFSYEQTVGNGRVVVRLLSLVLEALRIDLASLHIIGHSLGAQFASFLSENYREKGLQIGQITGLDPAGPFFEKTPAEVRIDQMDAKFVDILHTCPGPRGIRYPSGDVDFYFNENEIQPGCVNNPDPVLCSHNLSVNYFEEAVDRECLFGYPAEFKPNQKDFPVVLKNKNTKIPVGLETVKSSQRGVFLVYTRPESPFCYA